MPHKDPAAKRAYHREYNRKYSLTEQRRKYNRDYQIRRKWGMSREEYDAFLAAGCAICGAPAEAVDHDHATGKIRGPLCNSCNNGLGRFKDKPERLRRAADYLEEHAE